MFTSKQAAARQFFAEQIYDLPCFTIIEPPPPGLHCCAPPVLSNGHITYGIFNRASKFSDSAISVWARILQSDPAARMLIKDAAIDDQSIKVSMLFSCIGLVGSFCLMTLGVDLGLSELGLSASLL